MRKTNRLLVLMSMMLLQVATPSFLSAEEIGSQSLVTQDKRTVTGIVLDSKSNPLEGVAIIEDGYTFKRIRFRIQNHTSHGSFVLSY